MGYIKRLGKEQPPSYYDNVYALPRRNVQKRYRGHYKYSKQYGIWKIAMGMIKSLNIHKPRILEVACGTGQFAKYLEDEGYKRYMGFDFSKTALRIARKMSTQTFQWADATDPELYKPSYNIIVAIEFFEHIENDIDIIKLMRPGTNIIFSVPIGGGCSHVRRFENEDEIYLRYGKYINITDIKRYGDDHIWFVCKGVIK